MDNLVVTDLFDLNRYTSVVNEDAVLYITSKNFDGGAGEIITKISNKVNFYELRVNNWDDNLTPWEADPKMKGRYFGGDACELLSRIEAEVIPIIRQGISPESKIYIAGYSLAGLFSLWALYESDAFDGAACCSGSLWYPGWPDYANNGKIQSNSKIYLSIGNREKNSRNEYMKKVEDIYLNQCDLLRGDTNVTDVHLDINEGGHFNDVTDRVVKGINWIIKR